MTQRTGIVWRIFSRWPPQYDKIQRSFLTAANSMVNVFLGTTRGDVEQGSMSSSCCKKQKNYYGRIGESNQENWSKEMFWLVPLAPPPDIKYQFITLNLLLHLLSTCLEVSFWPFEQISVFLLEKPRKAASYPCTYRSISLASHAGKMLGSIIDNRIRNLDFLKIEKEQNGFEESCATRNIHSNWYTTWN